MDSDNELAHTANVSSVGGDSPISAQAAQQFADRFADARQEKQLAQTFWRDFFTTVCAVADPLSAGIEFEYPVRSTTTGTIGFIDVLWPGVVLIEHKSRGQDLNKAEQQARDYLISLDPAKRPPVIIVCDFGRWRIVEVLAGTSIEFTLDQLPDHLTRIEAIIGDRGRGASHTEAAADAHAAELMSALYVAFESAGYGGHEVSVFLVRVLFVLFGDDTRMWKRNGDRGLFQSLVEDTPPSGSGLGGTIQELFQVLNTPRDDRPTTLPEDLAAFPYVNGGLFTENLPVFSFTTEMRQALVDACQYDWSSINPSIFGAIFQNIKSRELRRNFGQHFTSETNIIKVIGPLFLDSLNDRLRKDWDSPSALRRFQRDLGTYTFADFAAGSGNFLLVSYKRIRDLELRIAARLVELQGKSDFALDGTWMLHVKLSQFYGVEYDEWSSEIASVAMFLAEHQANLTMERLLGQAPDLLPLSDAAHIIHGNALRMDWEDVCPMSERTFIMGNPPFNGARWQSPEQKDDTRLVWHNARGCGDLDYVTNWFYKAAEMCSRYGAHAAFVATSSITQGEQPPILWGHLFSLGVGIPFAHRTFRWTNDASGQAAVHTVIIGLSAEALPLRRPLWTYATPDSPAQLHMARNINPYLLDAPNVLIAARRTPLSPELPRMDFGSMPNDGGYLSSLSSDDVEQIRQADPTAATYLRRLVGGQEVLHSQERYCLWLDGADPGDIRKSPELSRRVNEVRKTREASRRAATQALAKRPTEFAENRQPKSEYLGVPLISSELRDYLPVALLDADVIANNKLGVISENTLLGFGVLTSRTFTVWNKAVSGRLESRLNVSISTTYNAFPLPPLSPDQRHAIEDAARSVLMARTFFPDATLATLYDPLAMPRQLLSAHHALDATVAEVFGLRSDATDEAVLAKLFEFYEQMMAGLFPTPSPSSSGRRAA